MKIVLEISKITISILILIFVLEACTRIFLFFLTTSDVFKYGFKKTVIFEVVDLSKFQILIIDKDKNEETKQIEIKTGNEKIWIFGGSTTRGYSCGEGQLTSWPDEVSKINKKFIFKNFAFSGANSDQQLNLMYINIEKNVPDIIMWANKFNTKNILGQTDYKNKHILNYEFQNAKKTKFIINAKRIDKTFETYSIFYSFLKKIMKRVTQRLAHDGVLKPIQINPTKKDIIYSVKNFEINTIEAIELSKKKRVKEFYIVSLFSADDFENKSFDIILYEETIQKLERRFQPFVRIIGRSKSVFETIKKSDLLCDKAHKTLKGEILQAKIINDDIVKFSNLLNE